MYSRVTDSQCGTLHCMIQFCDWLILKDGHVHMYFENGGQVELGLTRF